MDNVERTKPKDKFVNVDGLQLRYIEEGSGPSVLFLHGASLGSSADVFLATSVLLLKPDFARLPSTSPVLSSPTSLPSKALRSSAIRFLNSSMPQVWARPR